MSNVRGDRIKYLRKKLGLTQEDVATKLGMNRVSYAHYESNKNTPPSNKLSQLADILKTNTEYLLGKTDDPSHFLFGGRQEEFDLVKGGLKEKSYEYKKYEEETHDWFVEIKQTKPLLDNLYDDPITNKLLIKTLESRIDELNGLIKESQEKYNVSENKEYPAFATRKDIRDLSEFLSQPEINFDGFPIDDEGRAKIKGFMEHMFWDAKERNKRK